MSIGWHPLDDCAYLHVGKPDEEEIVITMVGVPDAAMVGMNVLLVGEGSVSLSCYFLP